MASWARSEVGVDPRGSCMMQEGFGVHSRHSFWHRAVIAVSPADGQLCNIDEDRSSRTQRELCMRCWALAARDARGRRGDSALHPPHAVVHFHLNTTQCHQAARKEAAK